MRIRTILLLLCASALWAQRVPPCRQTLLDTYLGFDCNSPQWQAIERNNDDHEIWRERKERRVYQVRGEIGEETQRSPLDPTALGLRYAEIEAICREIDEREQQLVVLNRNALTEPQKTKLAALEAAMELVQTGNQAILRKLMGGTPSGIFVVPVDRVSTSQLIPARQRTGACAIAPGSVIPASRLVIP